MPTFSDRLKHAWNAFMNRDPPKFNLGVANSYRPDRPRFTRGKERTIITSIYNRVAMDCAAVRLEHVKLDEEERYVETMKSDLNNCLILEANLDQTSRAFIQDIVMSMFDEGVVAVVPVDTNVTIQNGNAFDIQSMRTGKVVEWYPKHVKVRLYNEKTALTEDVIVPKHSTAIIENPFYAVMNEQNSTMQRLIRKLNILDAIDEQSGSGKLDMIIQLPYIIKTEARKEQAEERRKDIEMQLMGSKYGIAYIDGTEKITQLNRSLDNHLMEQIEYLTTMLYSQLGITKEILEGTADEQTMLNYNNRMIEPIMSAIADEFKRKFLSKTARSQHQSIVYFRDPFKLVPVNNLADIADKFTRNEIMSSNEFRQVVGMKPVGDPRADELRNKNINAGVGEEFATTGEGEGEEPIIEDPGPIDEAAEESVEQPAVQFNFDALLAMPLSELRKQNQME